MTENEAIKELKDENEQCYEQCDGCCSEVEENICTCRDAIILSVLEQYRTIGTVGECHEARERQMPKKLIVWANKREHCPNENCEKDLSQIGFPSFCPDCGQALDWSDVS